MTCRLAADLPPSTSRDWFAVPPGATTVCSCRMLPRMMTMFRIALMTADWIYTRRFNGMKAQHMIYFNTINRQLVSQESLLGFLLLTILRLRLGKSLKRRILNRMCTLLISRNVIHHFCFKNHLNFISSKFYGHIFSFN